MGPAHGGRVGRSPCAPGGCPAPRQARPRAGSRGGDGHRRGSAAPRARVPPGKGQRRRPLGGDGPERQAEGRARSRRADRLPGGRCGAPPVRGRILRPDHASQHAAVHRRGGARAAARRPGRSWPPAGAAPLPSTRRRPRSIGHSPSGRSSPTPPARWAWAPIGWAASPAHEHRPSPPRPGQPLGRRGSHPRPAARARGSPAPTRPRVPPRHDHQPRPRGRGGTSSGRRRRDPRRHERRRPHRPGWRGSRGHRTRRSA